MSNTSNVFQNLSDYEVEQFYKKFENQGLSEEEIFNEIYNIDCSMDEE